MEELLAKSLRKRLIKDPDQDGLLDFMNKEELKSIPKSQGALLTLYTEARRRKWNKDQLKTYLEGLDLDLNLDQVLDGYKELEPSIDECLKNTILRQARLTSFRVETFYEVYNSTSGRVGQPKCLVELDLLQADNKQDKVEFVCNVNELQALVTTLKDMKNILNKI